MDPRWRLSRRSLVRLCGLSALLVVTVGVVSAHGGSLGSSGRQTVTIPTWLVLLTGGAAVGASFLLASLVTDRRLIRDIESYHRVLSDSDRLAGWVQSALRVVGVTALGVTLVVCLVGPQAALANLGLLVVWVGWWAGFTMSTYLFGNTWPVVNPWRTLTEPLPSLGYTYPDRLGVWPAVVALLALIWLEVVSPIADSPRVLGGVVVAYTLVTVAGSVVYGETWFRRADPISRVFSHYGHVAPLQREGNSVVVRLPGSGLSDLSLSDRSQVVFVVALLWVTTFDGFVATPAWRTVAETFSTVVPLSVLYPLALVAGFGLFVGVYDVASRASKRLADTHLAGDELARQFAPSLLAIAAGYHLAHYLGYFVSLAPVLAVVASAPLNPPAEVTLIALPGWFDIVGMGAILVGHLLAIWVAHTTAYDIFPGRLQAIRSQYPFIAVMVFYTMTSLWIIAQPEVVPP